MSDSSESITNTPSDTTGEKKKTGIMTLLAETFLHPGTGQSAGSIDLPIQRERHTNFPMIRSTGLKGSLRDLAEQKWKGNGIPNGAKIIETIFGPDTNDADAGAGVLAVTDARILAFPVRSLQKVFVWITCPMVIERLKRDVKLADISTKLPSLTVDGEKCKVIQGKFTGNLILEDQLLTIVDNIKIGSGAEAKDEIELLSDELSNLCPNDATDLKERLVLVSDEDFAHLVTYATQVSARIHLTGGKTTNKWTNPITNKTESGNLWYEETLPPETIMYSLLLANKPRINGNGSGITTATKVMERVQELFPTDKNYLQIGGNETVGQGWCSVKIPKEALNEPNIRTKAGKVRS